MSTLICPLAADIGLYMWCVKESSFRRKRGTERIRFAPTTYSYLQTTSTSSIPEPIQSPTPCHIFSISLCYLFAQTLRYLPPTKRMTVVGGGGGLSAHVPPSLNGSSGPIIVHNPMCICAVVWSVAVSLHLFSTWRISRKKMTWPWGKCRSVFLMRCQWFKLRITPPTITIEPWVNWMMISQAWGRYFCRSEEEEEEEEETIWHCVKRKDGIREWEWERRFQENIFFKGAFGDGVLCGHEELCMPFHPFFFFFSSITWLVYTEQFK